MAKKKKQTKKKATEPVAKAPSPVVGYVLAVVFILAALFIFIGGSAKGSFWRGIVAIWLGRVAGAHKPAVLGFLQIYE